MEGNSQDLPGPQSHPDFIAATRLCGPEMENPADILLNY